MISFSCLRLFFFSLSLVFALVGSWASFGRALNSGDRCQSSVSVRLLGRLGEGASFLLDYVILFAEGILIAEGGQCHPLLFLLNVPWAALCLGGGKGVPIRFQDQFFWSESRRLGNGTGVGGGGGLWGQWG